jgi:1-acyl-sn-glycerol-3-phosphate acyltransferase
MINADKNITDDIVNANYFSTDKVWKVLRPMRAYFDPRYFGLENVDSQKPSLFVCNHSIYGLWDAVLMGAELYHRKKILLRGLGDINQFKVPGIREMMTKLAAVPGTRENCAKLMKAGQHVLVYPGGGREVCRRKGEQYKLIWKQRTGFVRMAIEHQYQIIPTAAVGIDNAYSIIFDANDLMNSIPGKILKMTGILDNVLRKGDGIPPVARGIGVTAFPRPERLYFSFGKPVETKHFKGKHEDKDTLFQIKQIVENNLNNQIKDLLLTREQDEDDQAMWRKLLKRM